MAVVSGKGPGIPDTAATAVSGMAREFRTQPWRLCPELPGGEGGIPDTAFSACSFNKDVNFILFERLHIFVSTHPANP